ncbi:hypothetical protein TWF696_005812 [Orbilia brochopaga]|uniref:Uncharacterized protein n=1 Tax=Orbilia brochopaga TaxID=3140254 RepID=A0AAV9UUF0_9PEZI
MAFNLLAEGFDKQPRRGGVGTTKVRALFQACKSDSSQVNPNRVCNADLTRPAIRSIVSNVIPDLDLAAFQRASISVTPSYCRLVYQFKTGSIEETSTIEIHQCREAKDAEFLLKNKLRDLGEVADASLNPNKIGTYGVAYPRGVISFARDTIYATIAGEALQERQLSDLAKALDSYFLAAQGATQRQKMVPRCIFPLTAAALANFDQMFGFEGSYILNKGDVIALRPNQDVTLILPPHDSQYRLSFAFVSDTKVVDLAKLQRVRGQHNFVAKAEGQTEVSLAVLHRTTFHMYRGWPVTIKVHEPSQEEILEDVWKTFDEIMDGQHPEFTTQLNRRY